MDTIIFAGLTGCIIGVVLATIRKIEIAKSDKRHQDQIDAFKKEHVEVELRAHDKKMTAAMHQVLDAVLSINPNLTSEERQKITDRLKDG